MEQTVIAVENISLVLKKQTILDQVSLTCKEGTITGLLGRNGSGKTMLMKCICGFVRPQKGRILVFGKEIGKETDYAPDTGIIIETPGFIGYYSGFRNLEVLAGICKKIDKEKIREVMQFVGLDPDEKKAVRKYSLGMRQRLGLAQAIMEKPGLLILDEPFNGLDAEGVEQMRQCLLSLRQKNTTILMASHTREDIEILCDRVFTMEHGKIAPSDNT